MTKAEEKRSREIQEEKRFHELIIKYGSPQAKRIVLGQDYKKDGYE